MPFKNTNFKKKGKKSVSKKNFEKNISKDNITIDGNMEVIRPDEFLFSKKQLMKRKNLIKEIEADGNWVKQKKKGKGSHLIYFTEYTSNLITVPSVLKMNHILQNLKNITLARQMKLLKINITGR
tara:strand:- start:1139 stop:1513 length:375 start_codon:yes stop_codon:yes gene_type:complete